MLVNISVAIAIVAVVLLVVVAVQPSHYRVARTATLAAPPAAVFAQVDDFRRWERWNPWQKLDPAARNTFAGPPSGTGAVFAWSGNKDVGEGRMTIIDSRPDERIRIRLDFVKPFRSTSIAEFTFEPEGDRTAVTWSMSGPRNFMTKAIGLVFSMDRMIGGKFEEGLARLKAVTEATVTVAGKE